jgi:hypothetical protein
MMRRRAVWSPALAALCFGAACGGSGRTVETATPTPTVSSTPPATGASWRVIPNPAFRIAGASIPNVGRVGNEVWLTAGTSQGIRLYRSGDGSNQTTADVISGLSSALQGTGFNPTETVPRQSAAGVRELYVLGLGPPGANRALVFRLQESGGGFVRSPSGAVFDPTAPDNQGFVGVPDVYRAGDGRLRLVYVDRGAARQNARTAISSDEGATFTAESTNPFGDVALSGPADTNVDPAVLALATGGYLAVTMRLTRLYLFSSGDGLIFTPLPVAPIEAASFITGATGLFDPTLVQLGDGTVLMYVTLEDSQRASSVVQATLRLQ